jgi:hypothetical protein
LKPIDRGTLLAVVESGVEQRPAARHESVFRVNSSGWDEQMKNGEQQVAAA